jgi:hypothetical protein
LATLSSVGLQGISAQVEAIMAEEQASQPTWVTVSGRIKHLHDLYGRYALEDRLQYDEIVSQSRAAIPDHIPKDVRKKQRSAYVSARWTHGNINPPAPSNPLPVGQYRAAFIRVDYRALNEEMYRQGREEVSVFSLQKYFWIHSAVANIPKMKARNNRRYAKDMDGLMLALRRGARCPWLLAPSVETDGIQLKAMLMTARDAHPGPDGFEQLPKSGYQLQAKPPIPLQSLIDKGRGVYNVKAVRCREDEAADIEVTAIDPGQVCIIRYTTAPASAWNRGNVSNLMNATETH